MESTIRLFKALPISDPDKTAENPELAKITLAKGFVFDPKVVAEYQDTEHLLSIVDQLYGRGSKELNQSFHKSFAKVRDASIRQLYFEQLVHYFTTYGAQTLGIYDERLVYIPAEELDAPELTDDVLITVIRGLTKEELKDKLLKLLSSGIALAEQTVKDALDVAAFVGINSDELEQINNHEVKAALYDHLDIVPSNPVEFLRFVVYRATNQSLLIKNDELINQIKARDNLDVAHYFHTYEIEHSLHRLAEIFLRFKPLFLAFRTNTVLRKRINRIRKLAVKHHKPMPEDLLNSVTHKLKIGEKLDIGEYVDALTNASVFRKIRLLYALKYRTTDADSILYRVRNGKSFAADFTFPDKGAAEFWYAFTTGYLVGELSEHLRGKKIFIPKGLHYGLPATEKQFTGNIPTGSWVEISEDAVVGIHWVNTDRTIDLDLSLNNINSKIGWDGLYRDRRNNIYYSGDNTTAPAPKGASELFHIGAEARGTWLLNVNFFNFWVGGEVPFKILAASEQRRNIRKSYVIDPNNLVGFSNSVIDVRQKTLGIVVADDDSTKFYFAEFNLGDRITSRYNRHSDQALKYLVSNYTNAISLNDVLVQAGAEIVTDPEGADIDLSPETVDKSTFIELLTGGQ